MSHADFVERRSQPRRPLTEVPSVTRVKVGPETVTVLNISRAGVLLESAKWLRCNSEVRLKVAGDSGEQLVRAQVIQSEVAGFDSAAMKYRTRVAFKTPLELIPEGDTEAAPAVEAQAPEAPAEVPVVEPTSQVEAAPVVVPTSQTEEAPPVVAEPTSQTEDAPMVVVPTSQTEEAPVVVPTSQVEQVAAPEPAEAEPVEEPVAMAEPIAPEPADADEPLAAAPAEEPVEADEPAAAAAASELDDFEEVLPDLEDMMPVVAATVADELDAMCLENEW